MTYESKKKIKKNWIFFLYVKINWKWKLLLNIKIIKYRWYTIKTYYKIVFKNKIIWFKLLKDFLKNKKNWEYCKKYIKNDI